MSNRFQLVDREFVHGAIEGVEFGPKVWCMMRSPAAVLIWVFGHSWSLNGHQRYAPPAMILLPDRVKVGNLKYQRVVDERRLSQKLVGDVWPKLQPTFGAEAYPWLLNVVQKRKLTALIEGGGPPLMPPRYDNEAAYRAWLQLPERGFVVRPAP